MPAPIRIHLDTDIGGDTDDLCALALLLGAPDVEITGITTCADRDGGRAAYVRHALALAGRDDVPVASGAFGFLGGVPHTPGLQDERFWPGLRPAAPSEPGAALDLLAASAASGATIVAIGPYTNLATLEALRPGVLGTAPVVTMGGYLRPPDPDLPPWGPDVDYNVQADRVAARIVLERLDPLIVPFPVCLRTWLRGADLPPLRAGRPLAALVARQAEAHAEVNHVAALAADTPGLPADLLNFQYDPLAVATALGWECVEVSTVRAALVERDGGALALEERPDGRPRRVVTGVDADAFNRAWAECVLRA